ncbi:hypothetical protein [Clostridium sp.]|uniref:hypothetical protein n=1 Tax=Clostridium sp. TaxID=1506 RepID=UPI00290F728A|nr:hypothetical protein [Clostridium sp.]MDU4738667.1 hypothetical protein [Clostridium sp.]
MKEKGYKFINISIYGYLCISMLLLAISNIFGFWTENFAGIVYGIFGLLGVTNIIIQNKYKIRDKSSIFYLFLISCVLTIFINSMKLSIIESQYIKIFAYLIVFIVMPFICGKYFAISLGKFNSKIINILLIAYGILLLFDILKGIGSYGYRIFSTTGNSLLQATAIMCLGSMFMANNIKNIKGIVWYMFFSLILLLVGSRGIAISYIISGAIVIYVYRKSDFIKIIRTIISLIIFGFILFICFKKVFLESDFLWRWQLLFQDIKLSGIKFSVIDPARYGLFIYGMSIFKENYLFGNIFYDGIAGLYIHNFFIDILVRIGMFGATIFYVFLLKNFKKYIYKSSDDFTKIAFKIIFIAMIINGIVATTLFYNPVFWVGFGYITSYRES